MSEHRWSLTPFDPATATEADWAAIHALRLAMRAMRAERYPDDPPMLKINQALGFRPYQNETM